MSTLTKRSPILTIAIAMIAVMATMLAPNAVGAADDIPKAETPVLITSAGQGNGVLVATALADRVKLPYDYSDVPTSKHIAAGVGLEGFVEGEGAHREIKSTAPKGTPYKTLIVVMGVSLKGMGASGLSIDTELARLKDILDYCRANNIFVVGMHVEGAAMRGKPGTQNDNERVIDAVVPKCDLVIVTKAGNQDGRFNELGAAHGVQVAEVSGNRDIQTIFETMFGLK